MENVKVAVRCRPLTSKEVDQKYKEIIKIDAKNKNVVVLNIGQRNRSEKLFTFDHLFGPKASQVEIYETLAKPLIDNIILGYNGTIIAYGQTGTGKTYTMEGDNLDGIIPNSFSHIFDKISKTDADSNFLVRISYLEIYNEEVRDLLGKDQNKRLEVVERPDIGVQVKNLSTYIVKNPQEMMSLMELGNKTRAIGTTDMNEHSSRSHAIFTITIECSTRVKTFPPQPDSSAIYESGAPTAELDTLANEGSAIIRMGKLHLVDLAGSERLSKSRAHLHGPHRVKEASKINYSLSCLGNVVSALTSSHTEGGIATGSSQDVGSTPQHVPYRNSKLTHILKDSLGGNSKTVMIANIGPADYNYEETLGTLRYAHRVKSIKNKAIINEDPKDAMIRKFQHEIDELKRMLAAEDRSLAGDFADLDLESPQGKHEGEETSSGETSSQPSDKENDGDGLRDKSVNGITKKRTLSQTKIQEIQREIDKEKKLLSDRKDMLGEEKNIVLQKLQQREKQLIDARLERDALTQKLVMMEKKIVSGGGPATNRDTGGISNENAYTNIEDEYVPNEYDMINNLYSEDAQNFDFAHIEQQLKASEIELDDRMKRRKALSTAIEENQAARNDMEEMYGSLKEEANAKTEKLKKLWEQILDAKSQLTEVRKDHQLRKDAALETIRSLNREYKLYSAIVDAFVPNGDLSPPILKKEKDTDKNMPSSAADEKSRHGYLDLIRANSEWNDRAQEWRLNCVAYSGNNMISATEEINFDELDANYKADFAVKSGNKDVVNQFEDQQAAKENIRRLFYGDAPSTNGGTSKIDESDVEEDDARLVNGLRYPSEVLKILDLEQNTQSSYVS